LNTTTDKHQTIGYYNRQAPDHWILQQTRTRPLDTTTDKHQTIGYYNRPFDTTTGEHQPIGYYNRQAPDNWILSMTDTSDKQHTILAHCAIKTVFNPPDWFISAGSGLFRAFSVFAIKTIRFSNSKLVNS